MNAAIWVLFAVAVAYLGLLFVIAYAVERGRIPASITRHPLTYALSLGVYATTWTYYGSVGFAAGNGYLFLAIYVGVTLTFAAAPVLLQPLLRLTRDYQLSSLADLMAFRYPSRATGVLVTVLMLVGLLPYLTLQLQAVVASAQVAAQQVPPPILALVFCITVALFSVLFGARQVSPRDKHEGLVVAIAFESLIKLLALLLVAGMAVWGVFGGTAGMGEWLRAHPEATEKMLAPLHQSAWPSLLLLAFAAAFLLPRQFHMTFTENLDPAALRTASWAFPVFMLVLNLAIPPLLWAGQAAQLAVAPEYYALGLARREGGTLLTLLVFIGGVSAASAMIIVESLALAAMALNHLVLPARMALLREPPADLYRWLLNTRRTLIALIIGAGYLMYVLVREPQGLVQTGLISFVAVAQFLPAVVGMLLWPQANRAGFIAGVSGGMLVWFGVLLLPLLGAAIPGLPAAGVPRIEFGAFWSLAVNVLLFVVGSLLAQPSPREEAADQACRLNAVVLVSARPTLRSPMALRDHLVPRLGERTATSEVQRALRELQLQWDERRGRPVHFLVERVERNLSGLIGPQLARKLLSDPAQPDAVRAEALLVEEELEDAEGRLSGLAAELNQLRRFHRQILQDLPIGVCSLGPAGDVRAWNQRMTEITGLSSDVIGTPLAELSAPWNQLLADFAAATETHAYKLLVPVGPQSRWLNLHKETVGPRAAGNTGCVILVEDLTEQRRLEAELAHNARLASIGTLASGVAHEIGNPLTGITCLAQNLRDEADPKERAQAIQEILAQGQRINDIVQSLLSFSRSGMLEQREWTRIELAHVVDEAIRLVRWSRSGRQIGFENQVPQDLAVEGDQAQLTQALLNLLTNAADASKPSGKVQVRATRGFGSISLQVQDWGAGMPESVRERVFEPFFTTKAPGQGTGLGLPLVYRIVTDHGGSISVDSREGEGTVFSLRLPAAPAADLRAAAQ